jgi:WD40 repeat protein
MGSADYIAPEQAADPRTADIRADIYALGCTLFHLLAGRPPFPEGTVQEKLARHARDPLPPLPDLPPGLAAVVARMTAKDPAVRFVTPAEVAGALSPFCVTGSVRSKVRTRLRRAVAVAALLVAGLLIAGIVLRLKTDRGEIVVQTDDKTLELTVRKNGEIIRIRDPHSRQTWDVDTKHYQIADADKPGGLVIKLSGRGTLTLHRQGGGTVTVTTGPKGVAVEKTGPPRLPTTEELAGRPNAADILKPADVPEVARAYVGGGDPRKAPPELVAVLGDTRFRVPERRGPVAFSPDGKLLAVASAGKVVRFFDAHTGRLMREFQSPVPLDSHLTFSPDGKSLAGTDRNRKFGLIEAATGRLLWKLEDTRLPRVDDFAFSADGKRIGMIGGFPCVAEEHDAATGKKLRSCETGLKRGNRLAFHPDQHRFAVLAEDGDGALCHFSGRRLGTLGRRCVLAAFSPDGKLMALARPAEGKADPEVTLYDSLTDLHVRHYLPLAAKEWPALLAFTPDGQRLIAVGKSRDATFVSRWDVATGKKLGTKTIPQPRDKFFNYALRPDGKELAVLVEGHDLLVRLYDTETGKQREVLPGHTEAVVALACSPDGKYLASSDRYATKLWNLEAREVATWKESLSHRLAFSPDGTVLALAGVTAVFVHRVPDGKLLQTLHARSGRVESLAFSPDGTQLAATGGGDDVRVWRVADGKQLRILGYPEHARDVTFSPDGSKLIAVGRHGIRVWDSVTGLESKDFLWECDCQLLEWLPDGKTLAVYRRGTTGNGIRHVDLDIGKVVRPKPGYQLGGSAYAVSSGARFLCDCQNDGFVLVQLGSDSQRRRVFRVGPRGPSPGATAAAFSPDGRYLFCGNSEGIISVLRLSERGKVPELQVHTPTARELAERPNGADVLKPVDVSEAARVYVGGGDPGRAPPELVAVLGEARFRCPRGAGRAAFSPDGRLLAVPTMRAVLLFDGGSGRLVRAVEGLWDTRDPVAFNRDGRTLAVGRTGANFRLLDVNTGKVLWKLEDDKLVLAEFAFSADGKQIGFTTYASNRIEVRAVASGKKLRTWMGPGRAINGFAFHTEPFRFASVAVGAEVPGAVGLWSLDAPRGGRTVHLGQEGVRVAFSPDGKWLAVACKDARQNSSWTILYHADDGFARPRRRIQVSAADVLAFTPDGKELITGSHLGGEPVVGRWQVTSGKRLGKRNVQLPRGVARQWSVSPDGRSLAVSIEGDPCVRLVAINPDGPRVWNAGHTRAVVALACSADGKRLVSAGEDGRIFVWDLATGRRVVRWKLDARLRRLALSPDGRLVATACEAPASSANKEDWLHLWDASGGMTTHSLSGHAGAVTDLAFSPDGRLLATASADRTVRLWGVEDGKEAAGLIHPQKVQAVAWSADGRFVASWSTDGTWIVREVGTRTEHRFVDRTPPWLVAFDLEGQQLATLMFKGARPAVGLFKWKEWKGNERDRVLSYPRSELKDIPGALALGPGPFLAAAASRLDGSLLVWQTKPLPNPSRQKLFLLAPRGDRPIRCVAISPEGRYVMAGGADGLIRVLRLAERGQAPELPEFPDVVELSQRPNAADALNPGDVPEAARAYVGGGDPKKAPPELVAVLGDTRFRCSANDETRALAFSPDGKLLAVPGGGVIRLFGSDGRLLHRLKLPREAGPVRGVTFSPNGKYLAAWDATTGTYLWDTTDAESLRRFGAITLAGAVAFSPDSKVLAVCAQWSNIVRLYEVPGGKPAGGWDTPQLVQARALAFWPAHPAGRVLVLATEGGIEVWEASHVGGAKAVFRQHLPAGSSITFSKDGKYLAACTGIAKWGVRLYDRDGKDVGRLATTDVGPMAFTPDGKELVMLGFSEQKPNRYTLGRWDLGSKKELLRKPLDLPGPSYCFALSPDGRRVAMRAYHPEETVVRLFDTANVPEFGHTRSITALAFSPDGKLLASSDGPTVRFWDLATGKTVRTLDLQSERARLLAFSPDSRVLVIVGSAVNLRNVADGRLLRNLPTRPGHSVGAVAFSPDGKSLATAGRDDTVSLWDVADGKEGRILGHPGSIWAISFAPDGSVVVSASHDGTLKVWEPATGTEKRTWKGEIVPRQVAFLPDGRTLAVLGQRTTDKVQLQLWDWERGRALARHTIAAPATGSSLCELGPAAHLVAFSGESGAVSLWQPGAEPGRGQSFRLSPADSHSRVAFSPDGRYVAVGNGDGTICLLRLAERGTVPEIPPGK